MYSDGPESANAWNALHGAPSSQPTCKAMLNWSKPFPRASIGMPGPEISSGGGLPFGQDSWKECVSKESSGPTMTIS